MKISRFDRRRLVASSIAVGGMAAGGAYLYSRADARASESAVLAVSSKNDGALWRSNVTFAVGPLSVSAGVVYVGNPKVSAVATTDGTVLWQREVAERISSISKVADGLLFVAAMGTLYALDVESGSEQWHFAPGEREFTTPPVVKDGRVYIGGSDIPMYAVLISDGSAIWTWHGPESSAVAESNGRVFLASDGVYAADAIDGSEVWRFTALSSSAVALAIDSGVVYAADITPVLHALDEDNGVELWHANLYQFGEHATLLVSEGTLYTFSGSTIHALSTSGGNELWKLDTSARYGIAKLLLVNGLLYAGDGDATLYVVDEANGTELWRIEDEDLGLDFSSFVVEDGVIYIRSSQDILFAYQVPEAVLTKVS